MFDIYVDNIEERTKQLDTCVVFVVSEQSKLCNTLLNILAKINIPDNFNPFLLRVENNKDAYDKMKLAVIPVALIYKKGELVNTVYGIDTPTNYLNKLKEAIK